MSQGFGVAPHFEFDPRWFSYIWAQMLDRARFWSALMHPGSEANSGESHAFAFIYSQCNNKVLCGSKSGMTRAFSTVINLLRHTKVLGFSEHRSRFFFVIWRIQRLAQKRNSVNHLISVAYISWHLFTFNNRVIWYDVVVHSAAFMPPAQLSGKHFQW